MRIPNRTSIFHDWTHQSFISYYFNILGQENKFLLKNPSVLLALVQVLVIWVLYFKSFVIVTLSLRVTLSSFTSVTLLLLLNLKHVPMHT